jgi:clan AA aspartic protease
VTPLAAWVDATFTGELVMPRGMIERLGLRQSAAVMAGLADGTHVVLETHSCIVDWFGQDRKVEVVENQGPFPLLGVGRLRDRRLAIDYRAQTLFIE